MLVLLFRNGQHRRADGPPPDRTWIEHIRGSIVSDTCDGVTNTHTVVSKVQQDVANTHAMVSDISRKVLGSPEGDDDQHRW